MAQQDDGSVVVQQNDGSARGRQEDAAGTAGQARRVSTVSISVAPAAHPHEIL